MKAGLNHVLGCMTVVLGALACVTSIPSPAAPQQGWWSDRGPVIPHEGFPSDCSLCHEGDDWHSIRADFEFDHFEETGEPLLGAHAAAECLRCHNDRGPIKVFAGRGCEGCHEDLHRGQLGRDCALCHDERSWDPLERLAFHDRTRLPLMGAHAATPCWSCHAGAEVGEFSRADPNCETCHLLTIAESVSPNHVALGWTSECDRCHVATRWESGDYEHPAFVLAGTHVVTDCIGCHSGAVYEGTPDECVLCHNDEYQRAPEHLAVGFSTTCEECHSEVTWSAVTGFTHPGISSSCDACHLEDDFLNTTEPDHQEMDFPMTCEDCHNYLAWIPGHFDHAGIVNKCDECHQDDADAVMEPSHEYFPPLCEECHNTIQWKFLNFDHNSVVDGCSECHIADYNTSTMPDHAFMGFEMTCENCHEYPTWTTIDPIVAAPQGERLFSHENIRSSCTRCHVDEYRRTTKPDHRAARFGRNCENCHGTHTWSGAQFPHRFPIQSGRHAGLRCTECHPNARNFRGGTTCTNCHDHSERQMAKSHARVRSYSFRDSACLRCHPDGH